MKVGKQWCQIQYATAGLANFEAAAEFRFSAAKNALYLINLLFDPASLLLQGKAVLG